jgi:large subunit ribosomal protein L15
VGRGRGSGHGKTSTRGANGHKARGQVNQNFEGGQTPLHRRIPQLRGFRAINKKIFAVVNVGELDIFDTGAEVTADTLMEAGVLRDIRDGLKILGDGDITKKLTVKANKFSKSAIEKLQSAGGVAEIVEPPIRVKKNGLDKREAELAKTPTAAKKTSAKKTEAKVVEAPAKAKKSSPGSAKAKVAKPPAKAKKSSPRNGEASET